MTQTNAQTGKVGQPGALTAPPVLPAARAGALSMLQDENVHLGDLAGVIEVDPALTLVLLRAANSAQSASRRHIDHPRDAMIRIGLAATKRLVAAAVVGGAFTDLGECGIDVDAFWVHSIAVAVVAESACTVSRLRPAAFSAGLLHDVGRLMLAASARRAYPAISERARSETMVLAAEGVIFGENHAIAGGRVLGSWGISPEIAAAVGGHHGQPATDLDRALLQARHVVEAVGYADGLSRRFEPPGQPPVEPSAASTLHARVEWYRSALRGAGV